MPVDSMQLSSASESFRSSNFGGGGLAFDLLPCGDSQRSPNSSSQFSSLASRSHYPEIFLGATQRRHPGLAMFDDVDNKSARSSVESDIIRSARCSVESDVINRDVTNEEDRTSLKENEVYSGAQLNGSMGGHVSNRSLAEDDLMLMKTRFSQDPRSPHRYQRRDFESTRVGVIRENNRAISGEDRIVEVKSEVFSRHESFPNLSDVKESLMRRQDLGYFNERSFAQQRNIYESSGDNFNSFDRYKREVDFDSKSADSYKQESKVMPSDNWDSVSDLEGPRRELSLDGPRRDLSLDSPRRNLSVETGSQSFAPRADRSAPRMKYPDEGEGGYDTTPLAAMLQRFSLPTSSECFSPNNKYFPSPQSRGLMPPGNQLGQDVARSFDKFDPLSVLNPQHCAELLPTTESESRRENQFYCHMCSFVGACEVDFSEHMKSHFEHQCPHCTYSSRTEGRLKRHISDFHTDKVSDQTAIRRLVAGKPKVLKCRQCKFSTIVREEFWAHSRVHIKKEKQLCCPRCEFVTEFKHHLEYHIRNHVGSKPYKCSKCTYMCVNKSMLNSHMKSHTNIYRYRCASCTYATKYAHSLKIHLRKKKHVPAVVLNEDGSLPTDGMGDFDLVSKRGPPKGPRSVRKSNDPNSRMDIESSEHLRNSLYAPFVNSTQAREPWFPRSSTEQAAASMHSPSRFSPYKQSPSSKQLEERNAQDYSYPQPYKMLDRLSDSDLPLSLFSSAFLPQSTNSAQQNLAAPMKCKICNLSYSSVTQLAHHFMESHTGEGHELLAAFGITPESLSSLTWPSPILKKELRMLTEQRCSVSPILSKYFSLRPSSEDALNDDVTLMSDGAAMDPESSERLSSRREYSPVDQRVEAPVKVEESLPKESVLDLSSRQALEGLGGRKRNFADEGEEYFDHVSSLSETSSPASGTFQVPRRRSRKGKACRLDVLSVNFQESWDEEVSGRSNQADDVKVSGSVQSSGPSSPEEANDSQTTQRSRGASFEGREVERKQSPDSYRINKVDSDDAIGQKTPSPLMNIQTSTSPAMIGKNISPSDSDESEQIPTACRSAKPSDNGFYMCQHCDIGFRDRITHSIHMGYHGFSDPFKCNMCGHRSADRIEFFLHMARVAHL